MRLKSQFAVLTAAVTIVPALFAALFFTFQQAPRDPRAPTREFIGTLAEIVKHGGSLDIATIKATAEAAGLPLKDIAYLNASGMVLESTFPSMPQGSQVMLSDLVPPQRGEGNASRPEFKLMPLISNNSGSPLLLFDTQPFWSRQDIRNRNLLFVGSFMLVLFVVSGVMSLLILRTLSRAINRIEKDTSIVATGDLDHEVAVVGNHEMKRLASSINRMRLNLKDMLTRRSKMLMGVSHDLKTPIALIQGYADALADNVAEDPDTRAKYVGVIRAKAQQLEDLTSDLIDFLKIGGDGTVEFEDSDLAEFLSAMGKRFATDAKLLGKRLEWGFGERCSPEPEGPRMKIRMNRQLAERALENLVGNALKFMRADGTAMLRLVSVEGVPAISVVDDGPGISDNDAPYVFDAFYRASPSRGDGGHGFGLTVVKAVADIHGWTVSLGKRRDGEPGAEALVVLGGEAKKT